MSLEDDIQALSSQLEDLQEMIPRLITSIDNLSGVVEGLAGDLHDAKQELLDR